MWNLYVEAKTFKELFNFKTFVISNHQELGNRFHSITARTCIDTFISFFPSLFVFLFLSTSQNYK